MFIRKTQCQQHFCTEGHIINKYKERDLTCDFKHVWLFGVDVDLPGSCLLVIIETNSNQVANYLYGPQFTIGLIVVLAYTWNMLACLISHKEVLQ